MSDATYRIDVEHRPDPHASRGVQWLARVVRLSDEYPMTTVWAENGDAALDKAREYLYEQNVKQTGRTLFVDDAGEDALPHSVKA